MVHDITKGGWVKNTEDLLDAVLISWDNVDMNSFRELVRSYRHHVMTICSVEGDRHPTYA